MPKDDPNEKEVHSEAPTPQQVRDARREAHSGEQKHRAMSHKGGRNKNQKRGDKGKASKGSKGRMGGQGAGGSEKDTGVGPR